MKLSPTLNALADQQSGVVTRRQLKDGGIPIGQIRWQLGRSWRQLLPGIVLLDKSVPTVHQRHIAAQLYGGPGSWLAGPTSAALLGFIPEAQGRVHVLGPPTVKPRDVEWVRVRRTHLLDERLIERGMLRLSCRPRAVVDAAAILPDDAARGLVIDAVRHQLVRLDDVTHWVEARETKGRLRLRGIVREAAAGAWSVPEADLAALVLTSSVVPAPMLNPELKDLKGKRLTTPDLWVDDVGMAIMVHSRAFHSGSLQWDDTVTDDSDLSSYRVVVLGIAPEQLATSPRTVLQRIEARYLNARQSGFRPAVVATPRLWFRDTA